MELSLARQIFSLLGAAGLLEFALSSFHPAASELKVISEIQWLSAREAGAYEKSPIQVIAVKAGEKTIQQGLPLSFELWDEQVENISANYHGRETLLVYCGQPDYQTGWELAKRLRHFGFPLVALVVYQAKS